MAINGTGGNDNLSGTGGGDLFRLRQGGDDTAAGLAGNDVFWMREAFNALDALDGGADTDKVALRGDYSSGVVFNATTLTNVEALRLGGAFDYNFTTHDATVAAGAQLAITAAASVGNIDFDGSAETDGSFKIFAGAENDTLAGGAKGDKFFLNAGGDDTAYGGGGKDAFTLGAAFNASDAIDGGAGNDTVNLDGDYSSGLVFGLTTLVDIETVVLAAGHSYNLTTSNATVAAGRTLTVSAGTLTAAQALTFNGGAETDGAFNITGGAGNDALTGGAQADTFVIGVGGNDTVHAGDGDDIVACFGELTEDDTIDGGAGFDTVLLQNTTFIDMDPTTMTNVEKITLSGGLAGYLVATDEATIAAGETLTIDGSAVAAPFGTMQVDGRQETDGHFHIISGSTNNGSILGGQQSDVFDFAQSGSLSSYQGNGGNDTFNLGALYNGNFEIIGGLGSDTATFDGDYSGGLTIESGQVYDFYRDEYIDTGFRLTENFVFYGGHSYTVNVNGDVTGGGGTLTLDASALGATDVLDTDFSSAATAAYVVTGGAGDDRITFSANFSGALSVVNGGAGNDWLIFDGSYAALALSDSNVTGMETLQFLGGADYHVTVTGDITPDFVTSTSTTLTVNANTGAGETFEIDLSGSSAAGHDVTGGSGINDITGSTGNDTIDVSAGTTNTVAGATGADDITCGAGADTLYYGGGSDSSGGPATHDVVHGLNMDTDVFNLDTVVNSFDGAVNGAVNSATFNPDIGNLINDVLTSNGAIVANATSGTLSGHSFLVIDTNNSGDYEDGTDIVIDITGFTGTITAGDFI